MNDMLFHWRCNPCLLPINYKEQNLLSTPILDENICSEAQNDVMQIVVRILMIKTKPQNESDLHNKTSEIVSMAQQPPYFSPLC